MSPKAFGLGILAKKSLDRIDNGTATRNDLVR